MPTFKIEYGMDVPAYGETLIHARSVKDAEAKARQMHKDGTLIDRWDPIGEISEDHRVLSISRDCGTEWKRVSDGFSLDEPSPEPAQPVEPAPGGELLWIAFDFENDRVVGHSNNTAGAVSLANRHPNARVARVLFQPPL
jgi:hypothetical protein